MLTTLGIVTLVGLLALILLRVTSVLVALTLVPVATALLGGFGREIGGFAMEGIRGVTPVAVLLAFAVIYFGVMNDAGLFEPLVRVVVRLVGRDPVRIALGTAAIAAASHLDGAGASTFMVTIPAMLPLYRRANMDARVLASITALAAGTMNMLPWAGPTTRAASALQTTPTAIFLPVAPAMAAGLVTVFVVAARMGRRERARLAASSSPASDASQAVDSSPTLVASGAASTDRAPGSEGVVGGQSDDRASRGLLLNAGRMWYVNALLTLTALGALFTETLPLPVVFLVASSLALVINYPDARVQRQRLTAHATAAMMMVTTIFAAGVFAGVLTKSGMLGAVSTDMVRILPEGVLRHLAVVMAVVSMPLSLAFDPDSFYFGLLPILAQASEAAGGVALEVGRAAVLGQMTTGFPVSPLTPATFLLMGLAGVDLADHQRRTVPAAFLVTVVMTAVAWASGAIGW